MVKPKDAPWILDNDLTKAPVYFVVKREGGVLAAYLDKNLAQQHKDKIGSGAYIVDTYLWVED